MAKDIQTVAVKEEDYEQEEQQLNSTGSKNTNKIKYRKTEGTNKNSSAVGTVGAREVVMGRKMAAVDTMTEREMTSVP